MSSVDRDIARIGDVLEAALARQPSRRRVVVGLRPAIAAALLLLLLVAGAVAAPRAREIVDGGLARLLGRADEAPATDVPAWIADARAGELVEESGRELARDGDQRVVVYRDAGRGWCVSYGDAAVDCDPTADLARFRRELDRDGMIVRGPYDGAPRAALRVDRKGRSAGEVIYVLAADGVARIRVRYANRRPFERDVARGAAIVRTRGAFPIAVDALDGEGRVLATRPVPRWDPIPIGPHLSPREALGVLRRPQRAGDRRDLAALQEASRIVAGERPDASSPGEMVAATARSVEVGGGVVSLAELTSGAAIVLKRAANEREGSGTVVVELPAGRPWNLTYGWNGVTLRSDFVISGVVADAVVRLDVRYGLDVIDLPIRENAVYLRIPAGGLNARFPDEVVATLADGSTVTGVA